MTIHASCAHGDNLTLCGLAEEGACMDDCETGDDEPPVFARPGEKITCLDCRSIIDHCRRYSYYKEPTVRSYR